MQMVNEPRIKTLKLPLLSLGLLMLLSACSNSQHLAEKSLLLNDAFEQCLAIPNKPETMLCINTKLINTGVPVNEAEFYLITSGERLKSLTSNTSGESSFGVMAFSPKGQYMYISYADEGHPYFVFYDTHKFIQDDKSAQVGLLFQYKLDYIDEFYDNGDVVYSLSDCFEEEVNAVAKIDNADNPFCDIRYNILSKKILSKH